MCVYQTSIDAVDQLPDMTTYVISDGCAAKSIEDHNTALKKLSNESVRVVSASEAESVFEESMKRRVSDGSDEWLMIEKIFSAGGVGKNDKMNREKLVSLLGTIQSDSMILTTLSDSLKGLSDKKQVSREDMHKILFKRKTRKTLLEKLPLFITIMYMPFLYSISTRLPFIFVALEITVGRGRDFWVVGLVLGLFQTSRALGNLIIVSFGGKNPFKRLQLPLILSALFGWMFLTSSGRPSEAGIFPSYRGLGDRIGDDKIFPLVALFFVGLCETIVILQRSLMLETAKESPSGIIDKKVLAKRFSLQHAFVSFGSLSAYTVGGWLYTNYGYYMVCDFGILIQIAHLIGAISYIILDKTRKRRIKRNHLNENELISFVIYHFQALSVISKYSQGVANGIENAMNLEQSGLSAAAINARQDRVLNHSLDEIFRRFFHQKSDDVACFEDLLASIDKAEASASLASKRPLVMSIGKRKLSKLVVFLMKLQGNGRLTKREFVSFWAPRIHLSMFKSSHEASVTVIWPYVRAVIATQAIAALCIGAFLSTALLSYTKRFGMEAAQVGFLLGIGEALGMIIIFAKSFFSSFGNFRNNSNLILKAIISRPLNVPAIIIFTGICTMLFATNNLLVAAVYQILLLSVDNLSVSLMNELIGTSLPPNKLKRYQGMGQWLRRLGSMVTAILGPILFGISEGLPFLLFGKFQVVCEETFGAHYIVYRNRSDAPDFPSALNRFPSRSNRHYLGIGSLVFDVCTRR